MVGRIRWSSLRLAVNGPFFSYDHEERAFRSSWRERETIYLSLLREEVEIVISRLESFEEIWWKYSIDPKFDRVHRVEEEPNEEKATKWSHLEDEQKTKTTRRRNMPSEVRERDGSLISVGHWVHSRGKEEEQIINGVQLMKIVSIVRRCTFGAVVLEEASAGISSSEWKNRCTDVVTIRNHDVLHDVHRYY